MTYTEEGIYLEPMSQVRERERLNEAVIATLGVTTDPEDYAYLKKRWEVYRVNPNRDFDPEIWPLIEALGSVDGIVPVWSCASHPDQGGSGMYFSVAVDHHGLKYMTQLLDLFLAESEHHLAGYLNGAALPDVHLRVSRLLRGGYSEEGSGYWKGLSWYSDFYLEHSPEAIKAHVEHLIRLASSLK